MPMVACPHCGFSNADGRSICKSCRQPLTAPTARVSAAPLPADELTRLLNEEIMRQVGAGWRLQSQTATTAQLMREVSNVNAIVLILLLCLAIVPGIIYAAVAKRTSSLYLSIDQYGALSRVLDGQGAVPAHASAQPAALTANGGAPNASARLAVLDTMKAEGRITDDEYQARRARILDEV